MVQKGRVYSGHRQNYTIEKAIGHGSGMGDVFIAKDQRQNPVVVKFSQNQGDSADQIRKEKLQFETQILKELTSFNNPYTVKYLDQARSSNLDDHFLVIEFLDGDHIEEKVGRHKMPEKEVIKISTKIAQALDGLHKHDAIHRDIKPKNIMIKSDGNPILIDFGGAKMLDKGLSKVDNVTGLYTKGWTCLHQMDQGARLTPQCDLYALGRTIFYMATGVDPAGLDDFRNSKLNPKIMLPIFSKKQKTILRQSCSQAFTDLVGKLLDPDHQTYHTATQLIQDLQRINPTQSGQNHLGTGSTPQPSGVSQYQQNAHIVLEGRKIILDQKWNAGLLIGKIHDQHKCEIQPQKQGEPRCNAPHQGENRFLGHSRCPKGCMCFANARHYTAPHHIRIWYDNTQKTWKVVNNVENFSPSAKKSPTSSWLKMKPKTSYPLNHNDEIALIYVAYPDPMPITFFFYDH